MAKSKLDRAKASRKRLADKVKERRGFAIRKGAMGVTSYGLGKLDAGFDIFGMNIQIPSFLGAPKTATVAAIGYAISLLSKDPDSNLANMGEGMGDSGASVALFQMGRGDTVAGVGQGNDPDDERDVQQLEAELDELSAMAAVADAAAVNEQ